MRRLILPLVVFFTVANAFAQDPDFHIYLCFGQSNMEGQGAIEAQDQSVDSRFQIMQAVNCTGQPEETWRTATPPLSRCNTGLGPADYFGREMVANLPSNIKVGIVHVAVAGCKIELFDKNNYQAYVNSLGANEQWMLNIINAYGGNPYARLVELAQLAQQDGVIKGILLHQGESNSGEQTWPSKVNTVYQNLLTDLGLNANDVPLLAGQVVDAAQGGLTAGHNTIINSLPNTIPTAHVISSSGCTDQADNLHFNSAGYRLLGERYANKMLELLGETEENDDNIVVRATGVEGGETLELIIDGQVVDTWTLGTSFATYTYNGPSTGTFRLNFTNDGGDRDVQIDYLQVDGVTYQAEDQQVNTGYYANGECGGGEYSEIMHCNGYIEFVIANCETDTDNDGTNDCVDECPNDPNKIAPGNCGCGVAEGCAPAEDYQTHIDWAIPGGNQGLAACKAKYLGNIVPSNWQANPIIRSDWGTYWNQMSQENAGKWGVVEGNQDQYSWGDLDIMYDYCQQNDIPFKHHVFIWGSQQPEWLAALPASEQLAEVEEWYSLFKQRYPNTAIIDVVNESLPGHAPDVAARDAMGGFNNGASIPYLANHPYLAKYGYGTGWDYIIYAFAKARDYFPDAILVLNDYNIINNVNNLNAHLEIVEILKERKLIDAVGIQSHAFSVDNLSASALQSNLDRLAQPGLPIHVTELDIRGDNNNEQQQLERYQRLLPIFYEHPAVAGVTLWGYVEGQNWFDYTGILNANGTERAAMTWLKQYMASQPDVCNLGGVEVSLTAPSNGDAFEVSTAITLSATATDDDGTITSVAFYAEGNLIGTDNSAPYSVSWTPTTTGTYELTAVATDNSGNQGTSTAIEVTVNVAQGPYGGTAHEIPGTIQLEEFDLGGNGFAYYDDTEGSETGVSFRDDEDVDIEESTDTGGGYNIGWAITGEWLEYTVNVAQTGTYDIDLRLAKDGDDGVVHIEMNGVDITGDVAVPNTGGWQVWQTVTVEGVALTAGEQVMRVVFETDYTNFNYVTYTLQVTDTDNDGTPDDEDACPNDPNKAASAGDCGCGIAETDTDADGIADCIDQYPNDADNDGVNTNDDCDDNDPQIGEAPTWYADVDGDGLGTPGTSTKDCNQPTGYVDNADDTNDADFDNDGVSTQDDCDDNNATVGAETVWYLDADGDGVGVAGSTEESCTQPDGYVSTAGDECPNDINKTLPGDCGCGATEESCLDCAGTPNGDAFYDNCNNCVASDDEACTQDCNNEWGGTAAEDVCGTCAGGSTGIDPVTNPQDCIATGIDDVYEDNLRVYPNPTAGTVYLPETSNWILRNAQGEHLLEGNSSQLNLSTLSDGIYFLQFSGKVVKVVKE